MNLVAQGLHMTWPQGLANIAFVELVSAFLHEGHERTGSLESSVFSSKNWTETSAFKEKSWGLSGVEVGHCGFDFVGFVAVVVLEGVNEGIQKEVAAF